MIASLAHFREDLRLYKVWVKFTEKDKQVEKQTLNINREADIDAGTDLLINASPGPATIGASSSQQGDMSKGKGKTKGDGKGRTKAKTATDATEPKPKKEKTPAQQTKQA